jgi:two-component system, cell cycle sensor histidine kinase PleC
MLQNTQRPLPGTPHKGWEPRAGMAFTVDAEAAALLDADAGARMLWAIDAASVDMPFALDSAMPAVQRLRQVAGASERIAGREETLIFWTARGVVRLACRLDGPPTPGKGAIFHVCTLERGPSMADREADHEADSGQVALGQWLAHELRTPLGAIIACAEILKNEHFGPLVSAQYRDYAQAIFDGAHHALGVVDGILKGDATRSGVPTFAFADLDPTGVVESCLAVARPLADRAGLVLAREYASRLPHIIADELSLRQMLLNLIGNAIKFARGGDRITVAVAYEHDGPLTISVADTGPGMPRVSCADAATQPRPNRPAGAGLGLGLPLTKALAAANGAALAIASTPGEGTRVTLSFGKDRIVPV